MNHSGMRYFVNTPWWLKKIYPSRLWEYPAREQEVYLTFDDGPDPQATPFVLDMLARYGAKAVFFCIGKNVDLYPDIYSRILQEGHQTGNHTYSHPNGWKTPDKEYEDDVRLAAISNHSVLFRPPYGKLRFSQARGVKKILGKNAVIVMWSILSGDFDPSISPVSCLENVMKHVRPGSIIVFHDSKKAFPVLKEVLPVVLEKLSKRGLRFGELKGADYE